MGEAHAREKGSTSYGLWLGVWWCFSKVVRGALWVPFLFLSDLSGTRYYLIPIVDVSINELNLLEVENILSFPLPS